MSSYQEHNSLIMWCIFFNDLGGIVELIIKFDCEVSRSAQKLRAVLYHIYAMKITQQSLA